MEIRRAALEDLPEVCALDAHLDAATQRRKIAAAEVLVCVRAGQVIGLLRWGLLWDQVPLMYLLFVAEEERGKGYGRALTTAWESRMAAAGHTFVLTSTQADEQAQHFYRKLGYTDIGGFVLPAEPLELLLYKPLD